MTFIFQQPGTARLLEAIDAAAEEAISGGGVFAFASRGGVEAFFSCHNLSELLIREQPFHLIVGVDAITNAEALLALNEKAEQFPALIVNAFLHDEPGSTFHPKFSWFRSGRELQVVAGSGNLTLRGLGQLAPLPGNWEAFSVQKFEGGDAERVYQDIDGWIVAQRELGTLCPLNDERVLEKAMVNGQIRFVGGGGNRRPVHRNPAAEREEDDVHLAESDSKVTEVLIRELPSTRLGQGDVGRSAHREFFGHNGIDKHILVQYVGLDNVLGGVENVWLFFNPASANYRLELRAISNMEYEVSEDDDRMILIASKFGSRSFRYSILLPISNREDYEGVKALLGPIREGRRLMRKVIVSPSTLREAWPGVPENLLPVVLSTAEP